MRLPIAATIAWMLLVAGGACAQTSAGESSTLLIPRTAEGTLDFVDPGSGLRLASVALDTGPRQVSVAPDDRLAAVLGCDTVSTPGPLRVSISIIDLERPRELRRIPVDMSACPRSLTWFDSDHVSVEAAALGTTLVIDVPTGHDLGAPTAETNAAIARAARTAAVPGASTVAVQQFIADGGRLQDIAVTTVIPRAVCHACTPGP